ncbi:fatty acid desaturase [Rhodoblastus sp.]|uniref:fatty acid desaturase n=1 Tax=Rhodoblastus sp. TaxID=1962975 RepID=UPI0035B1DA5D
MTEQIFKERDKLLLSDWAQLRFTSQNFLFVASGVGLMKGGAWIWAPYLALLLLALVADEWGGEDRTNNAAPPTALQNAMLMLNGPLLALNAILFAYLFASGDPLGLSAALRPLGIDLDAARQTTTGINLGIAVLVQGFNWALGLNAAHELLHRTDSPRDLALSRWISALGGDPWFSIHHPAIHHRYLGLPSDPGTPARGMSLYRFYPSVYIGNIVAGARFEHERLRRRGVSLWSLENRFLTGWLILAVVAGCFFLIAGWKGVAVFALGAALGRFFLAATDYVQHYGVLRVEGEPLDARLSWDVYHVGTNAVLYSIGRHSDHHIYPRRACGDLKTRADAPAHQHGYLVMIGLALVPPLFMRAMKPKLDEWDRTFATDADLAFMRERGIPCAQRG